MTGEMMTQKCDQKRRESDPTYRRDQPWPSALHVVVDEAQDLHAAHWKMLRAMVHDGARNDIFCVDDTHQRIYDNVVSLGSLGINIRGRSARLTLNTGPPNKSWSQRSDYWVGKATMTSTVGSMTSSAIAQSFRVRHRLCADSIPWQPSWTASPTI